jgi:hypothetical protein
LNAILQGYRSKLRGRIHGDRHGIDIHYAFLPNGIETVIQVLAETGRLSSGMKFSASTRGFADDVVSLCDGTFCGTGTVFEHFMDVDKRQELRIVLEMDGSQYRWAFKAGVGVLAAPQHPVPGFSQYFAMNVSFRTRGKAVSGWQWSCICYVLSTKAYL